MKWLILLFVILSFPLSAQEFKIDTSRGEQTVVIPEGYTAEEAFQEMAVLYLEERWDHEQTQEDLDRALTQLDQYPELVSEYQEEVNNLIERYDELEEIYEKALRPEALRPVVLASYGYSIYGPTMGVGMGVRLFERLDVNIIGEYPPTIKLGVGIRF